MIPTQAVKQLIPWVLSPTSSLIEAASVMVTRKATTNIQIRVFMSVIITAMIY